MTHHPDTYGGADDPSGPDPALRRALRSVDPGTADPTYWFRFRSHAMASAARELARRRMLADLTVSDLVVSWGRTLVPAALVAATLAALLLARGVPGPGVLPLGVEEQLAEGLDGAPIPTVLASEDPPDAGGVIFAAEAY